MMHAEGRRLVRALLLGFLVFLLIGSGTGFALAASGAEGRRLQVPTPGPGDRAVYEGRTVTLDPSARPLDVAVRMELEWLPAVQAVDQDFVVREAHPLRSSITWAVGLPNEGTYERYAYYDAVTGEPLLRMSNGTSETDDGWNYGIVADGTLGAPPERTDFLQEVFTGRMGECGMRVPFQGSTYGGGRFTTAGVCTWSGPATYRPLGWTGRGEARAYSFAAVADERFRLAYDNAAPFPTRFHSALNVNLLSPEWAWGRHVAFERVAWERSGLGYGEPRPSHDLGGVRIADRTPWMLADDGVQHPFPLREAFAAAMAEVDRSAALPTNSGSGPSTAAEFQDAHPDAYLALAIFQFAADRQGGLHPNWWLAFTDGHDVLARRVERAPPAVADGALYLPQTVGSQDRVYVWNPDPAVVTTEADGVFPLPADLPSGLPVVADALARYEDMTGRRPSAYGFDIRCADDACSAIDAHVAAGESRADLETVASSAASPVVATRTIFDHIWIAADGHLESRVSFEKEHAGRVHLVPSQVGAREAPESATMGSAAIWHAPPGTAVASVSFLALVASLVYYFWPALKGAGLGMFSRTRDDELLQHPRRAQIVQLVDAVPGIHFQDLGRRLTMGRGNLEHHLRKLLAAGLLTKVHDAGYACYFPKGKVDRHLMAAAPVLRSPSGRAILDAVRARSGQSGRQIAIELGLSQSTVSYHLRRLQEAGLVFGAGDGAGVRLSPLGEQAAVAAA
jgi:predicted transcriptional regulator